MKKVLFLLIMVVAGLSASAQITWNVKGGVGLAKCWGDAEDLQSHFVGKIGAGLEKPLSSNWSLMPSLEVAWKGAEEEYGNEKLSLDLFYVQIPILAAYRLNVNERWNITFKAGPYFALCAIGRIHTPGEDYDFFDDEFALGGNRLDVGLDVGLDFEYHRFVFGLEYEAGFISIQKGEYSLKNSAYYATVGYKF